MKQIKKLAITRQTVRTLGTAAVKEIVGGFTAKCTFGDEESHAPTCGNHQTCSFNH